MLKAAGDWDALGEPERAALCRAIHAFRAGEYDESAQGYDIAGVTDMVVTSRMLAAKLRADYDAAEQILKGSEMSHLHEALLGDREAWLAEAHALAANRERARAREDRKRRGARAPAQPSQTVNPDELVAPIVDAVTRYPGLTCERIAEVIERPTDAVKPHLAALTAGGPLRKVGRGRGTRYHPA